MGRYAHIVVMGSGPAGVATACALHRLGHEVLRIGAGGGAAVEGLSWRTVQRLRAAGLDEAADSVSDPGARSGTWAGQPVPVSAEHIVEREEFDRALLRDAQRWCVPERHERVIRVTSLDGRWRVHSAGGPVDCAVLIDARGRRVQRIGARGPGLVAVAQRFSLGGAREVLTRVHALGRGWCWLAGDGRGTVWLQSIVSHRDPALRAGLQRHMAQCVATMGGFVPQLRGATAVGAPVARAATATLAQRAERPGMLPVGDAQMAIDPLCGHGIYEALRGAEVATAAAHNLAEGLEWDLVERFVNERVAELWRRRSAIAAEFYARQAGHASSAFWRASARRYELSGKAQPMRAARPACIERRAVLNGGKIEERAVVVTEQYPRGVWQVGRVDLIALIDLLNRTANADLVGLARDLDRPVAAVSSALRWLRNAGILGERADPALVEADRVGRAVSV